MIYMVYIESEVIIMLCDKIKSLRCEKGLSQEEFANRLSVVRQTVSKWENGLSLPDSDMLIRIAKELDTTVSQLLCDETAENIIIEKPSSKKTNIISIILIILGFPIWFSLAAALFAVILSVYILLWVIIISLWAVFASLVGCSFGGLASGVLFVFGGNLPSGIAMISAGLICAGLSIFMYFGCRAATKGILMLTKKFTLWIKSFFSKRRGCYE